MPNKGPFQPREVLKGAVGNPSRIQNFRASDALAMKKGKQADRVEKQAKGLSKGALGRGNKEMREMASGTELAKKRPAPMPAMPKAKTSVIPPVKPSTKAPKPIKK